MANPTMSTGDTSVPSLNNWPDQSPLRGCRGVTLPFGLRSSRWYTEVLCRWTVRLRWNEAGRKSRVWTNSGCHLGHHRTQLLIRPSSTTNARMTSRVTRPVRNSSGGTVVSVDIVPTLDRDGIHILTRLAPGRLEVARTWDMHANCTVSGSNWGHLNESTSHYHFRADGWTKSVSRDLGDEAIPSVSKKYSRYSYYSWIFMSSLE
jgi:hypothetical protein